VAPMLYEAFRHLSSFQEQEEQCASEKRQIGLTAASLISDGETIAIGAGTTTTQLARCIRHRRKLRIVTNAINIGMELSHLPDIEVYITGGSLSGAWFALVGDVAQRTVGEIFCDKAFIGVDGVHAEHGVTTNYPDQAAIHRVMMRQARQRIVVADHRKVGTVGRSLICPASEIDKLVVDKSTTEEAIAPFIAKDIVVLRG
jgi:DeoR/GlpR family transcriptional regulator of sugar metabolism